MLYPALLDYFSLFRGLEALHADRDTQVHIIASVIARGHRQSIHSQIQNGCLSIFLIFGEKYVPQILGNARGFHGKGPTKENKITIHSLLALDKSLPQTSGSPLLESCSASEKSERVEWKVGMGKCNSHSK